MTMIQIRFVFRDSLGQLHSDKPAKIILPQPLPHQLENGTDIRTIKDAIAYLQQREIPKRLWNIENNQVKAVHTVCRDGLETTQQGPMFAIYDNDVIAHSMVPDEDYIIVTSKEDEAVVAGNNDDGDATTETMEETQTQTTKNTLVVANVNDTIPDNYQLTPIQTLLDHQATDLPSTTAQKKKSPNEYYKNTNVEQVQPLNVEQVPLLTTQKRKESALESNVTTNAKKMKLAMQTVERKDSDVAPDSPNVVQGSLSTASKRKESTPECNAVTETNKSKVGTQTDTLDGQINKDSDKRTNFDERWMERFQKLKEYKKNNGHMKVQGFEDKSLYNWISNQRNCKRNSKMREDRLKLLEQIGFRWEREHIQSYFDECWMERFQKLKEYKKNNGHMKVQGFEDKDLYNWISNQRNCKRHSNMREDRLKLLEQIGFRWEREHIQSFHGRRMNTINTGIEHVLPPTVQKRKESMPESDTTTGFTSIEQESLSTAQKRNESTLESEIATESKKLKSGTMTDNLDRQKNAECGSNSDSDSVLQSSWKKQFQQLKRFHKKNGHSHILKSHPILGAWATQLKTNSVYDKLTDEQKAELASVNFYLFNKMQDPRQEKWDKRWMERFNKLKEYASKNGNMKVRGCEDKDLYNWINTQRLWKRKNKLQKDRIKLLDELGFKWDSHIEQVSHSKTSKFEEYTTESDTVTDSTRAEKVPLSIAQKRKDPAPESGIVPDSMQFIHRTKFDERWLEWFHKLKEYKRKHGHVMVRVTEDKDLYGWMSNQRKFKRNSNLREDRVKLLKEVGFSWESNTSIKQVSTSAAQYRKESMPESNTTTESTSVEQVPLSIAQKRKEPAIESGIVFDSMQYTGRPKFDERWVERFHKLKEYKMKHGHTMVRWIEDKDLYTWIRNQRSFKRHSKLRNDRMKLLEEIGLCWESNTSIAQKRKESSPEIDTATDSTGREQVLPSKEPTKESTQECDTKTETKKFKIVKQTDENQETPNEGSLNSASDEQSLLSTASKRKESTAESDTVIGSKILQVEEQTDQNRETSNDCTITSDSLEQVSFSESWMKNYHKLKEYKNRNGHTTVLMRHDKDLHEWAVHQRDSKRNNELCESRVTLLEEIGFKWSKRRHVQEYSDERWMNKYGKLQKYKKKHDHVMVKGSEDKELYTWTVTQRFTKRRNELCEDRVKLLEDVGFVWKVDKLVTNESDEQKIRGDEKEKLDARIERWMKNYHKLKDFKKKHGHLRLRESQDRALYRWVLNQRTRKGSMYEDRVKLLEDIGFVWDIRSANKSGTNLSATKQSPQKMKSRSPPSLKVMQRSSYKKRKRGSENDDIQSHPFQQPVPKKLPKSLALPADFENLNKLHQFVRSDLLEIVQDDQLKMVGLQCIFCKTSPEPQSRSKFFPQYLENEGLGLYRKTCEWQRVHFKQCTQIPESMKEKYNKLKLADKSRGKVQYWEDSAKQIGLFNKQGGGIGFIGDTNDGNSEAELARE